MKWILVKCLQTLSILLFDVVMLNETLDVVVEGGGLN